MFCKAFSIPATISASSANIPTYKGRQAEAGVCIQDNSVGLAFRSTNGPAVTPIYDTWDRLLPPPPPRT